MNRTPDLLITNELLYRLSYSGVSLNCREEPPGGKSLKVETTFKEAGL